jgi:hypothetical protein
MNSSSLEQTRRQAFDLMEQALRLLDGIDEQETAVLLDHAIAVMSLREGIPQAARTQAKASGGGTS